MATKIDLLVCKCGSCTHWEIGRDVIICKTCGVHFPAKVEVDTSSIPEIHWQDEDPEHPDTGE
jgi:hypothetical protein